MSNILEIDRHKNHVVHYPSSDPALHETLCGYTKANSPGSKIYSTDGPVNCTACLELVAKCKEILRNES